MIERKNLEIKYLSKENDQFYVEKKIKLLKRTDPCRIQKSVLRNCLTYCLTFGGQIKMPGFFIS